MTLHGQIYLLNLKVGTPIIAQAIGLGEAIRYIEKLGFDAIHEHEKH